MRVAAVVRTTAINVPQGVRKGHVKCRAVCREAWSAVGDCSLHRSGTVFMVLIAVFGVALLIAVLVSGLAARSILSTSLLFLVAGALVGDGAFGLIHITADSPIVSVTADLALFAVLF